MDAELVILLTDRYVYYCAGESRATDIEQAGGAEAIVQINYGIE